MKKQRQRARKTEGGKSPEMQEERERQKRAGMEWEQARKEKKEGKEE